MQRPGQAVSRRITILHDDAGSDLALKNVTDVALPGLLG
jgi:hypothetical protein